MSFRIPGFFFFIAFLPHAFAGLPTLKPKIGAPILEELMGGCSLHCAFPWQVFVFGEKPQPIYSTNDDCARTAWIDDRAGGSIGSKLEFVFPDRSVREMPGTPLYGFDIINGDWSPDDGAGGNLRRWKQHARIRKLQLAYDDQPLYTVVLADTPRWQTVWFDDIIIKPGDRMTFEILEVYPGRENPGVAVSEIVLQGAH
jgi:hypothetical protein